MINFCISFQAYLFWPDDETNQNKGSIKKKRRSGERVTRVVEKFPPTSEDLPKKGFKKILLEIEDKTFLLQFIIY